MQEVKKQLSANPNALVKLPTEIGPLRDATVGWIQAACNYFKANPDVVKQVSDNTAQVLRLNTHI
jgi:hypothetical protein